MLLDYYKGYTGGIVIALGYFDSVHKGHRVLISKAKELAKKNGAECAVFTFSDNLYKAVGGTEPQIYTFEERQDIIYNLGAEHILAVKPDKEFIMLSPTAFLNGLIERFNVKGIVCGSDFKFGVYAEGDLNYLNKFLTQSSISLIIIDLVKFMQQKISSSDIRRLIINGEIARANELLNSPYMVMGTVIKGRGEGRNLGFPTVNVTLSEDKLRLLEGVYATTILFEGREYDSLTNVGGKPTFGIDNYNLETFIINYSGPELYDKMIKILFYDRIRDIIRFSNKEELALQIKFDLEYSRNIPRRLK
jgi:riboflavin kinase/FMN adenylyltransferase